MDGRAGTGKRKRAARVREASPETSGDSDAFLDDEKADALSQEGRDAAGSSAIHPVVIIDGPSQTTPDLSSQQAKPVVIGGALKRKADGSIEQPRVVKQRTKSSVNFVSSLR